MSDFFDNVDRENCIAVVGMQCLLPGASDARAFWENLCEGFEAVQDLSDEELRARGVPEQMLARPDYVKAAIQLDGVKDFDYAFFGTSPKDAAVMDPQHRKFLECAWGALEDSGHKPSDCNGAIGMFASAGMPWYLIRNVLTHRDLVKEMGEFQVRHLSNDKDFLATRASYAMNLHGPSLTVQTACSSSLVAVHLAIQSLLFNESDIAIAGGSTIDVPQGVGYQYREEEVRSNDGRCRTFDKDSTGTAFGSGSAAVVLRRLDDAIEDGDSIHAVILGSAVNNDGSEKAGYMAPSVDYQANAIAEAMAVAGISADDIGYFETHGTGTKIGDPIEVAALTQAFGNTERKQYCGIGSVKTNIGHLDTAAGVASLIKAVHCVRDGRIPASLHYKSPNPEIDFENSPFFVNSELSDWPDDARPRIAGVSSLGVGGTNAHLFVSQPPEAASARATSTTEIDIPRLLPLSARTETSLVRYKTLLAEYFDAGSSPLMEDVEYTLQDGRSDFEARSFAIGSSASEIAVSLKAINAVVGRARKQPPKLAFMFSGQGAQYPGMSTGLYAASPTYRAAMDECLGILDDAGVKGVRDALQSEKSDPDAAAALKDTALTQPALFAVEYALARYWHSLGVQADAMMGHSLGEYVAATLAGVFELSDALRLVAARGKLISELEHGSMISVALSADAVKPYIGDGVSVAGENAPELTVLSGPDDAIERVATALEKDGHIARKLHTSHAFHSSMLDPIIGEFEKLVEQANPQAPKQQFISNVSGKWITEQQATSPEYWSQHLRSTVRFRDGIDTIREVGDVFFLELGPGNTLSELTKMTLAATDADLVSPSLPHAKSDTADSMVLLEALGRQWVVGRPIDWSKVRANESGRRVSLPTYAFDKHECWLDPVEQQQTETDSPVALPIEDWGYVENWSRQFPVASLSPASTDTILAFVTDDSIGEQLVQTLAGGGCSVIRVSPGNTFSQRDNNDFVIDPAKDADYEALFSELRDSAPTAIVHAWNLLPDSAAGGLGLTEDLDRSFYSLLNLAKRIVGSVDDPLEILIATSAALDVHDEPVVPARATLMGPLRVIPNEIEGTRCRLVDIAAADVNRDPTLAARTIVSELHNKPEYAVTAYRGGERFTQSFDQVSIPKVESGESLSSDGVYLITGAFGGLGRQIAEYLAKSYQCALVLVSRSSSPSTAESNSREQFVSYLESLGADVHRIEADIAQENKLSSAMEIVKHRFGQINGVFHAAGHIDDQLIAMKDRQSAMAVLTPKVQGTLALENALAWCEPEFQINYSSISVLAGLPGQIDYSSANAFLDAYSHQRNKDGNTRHLSIAWSSWSDSGMSARMDIENSIPTADADAARRLSDDTFSHVIDRSDGADFYGAISSNTAWFLDEHRLKSGAAILPGTAYIQLLASAIAFWRGQRPVEITDLIFASPMEVGRGERRILHCEIRHRGQENSYEIALYSWGKQGDEPIEHVHAGFSLLASENAPDRSRINPDIFPAAGDIAQVENPLLDFGPRWSCLANKFVSSDGASLELRLPEDYCSDLHRAPLHPAMMDIATGGAPELYDNSDGNGGGIVPFRYRSLRLWKPLTPHVFSLISAPNDADPESPETDIRVISTDGEVLVEIHGFAVRRVDIDQLHGQANSGESSAKLDTDFDLQGIGTVDGHELINRLIAIGASGHVVVSPANLKRTLDHLLRQVTADESVDEASQDSQNFLERPALATAYAAPEGDIQESIATTWQAALGIAGIGIDDEFFELGGHSLLLTQVVSRLRREKGWNLPLDKVFDDATIRRWAEIIDSSDSSTMQTPAIKRVDRRKYRAASTDA